MICFFLGNIHRFILDLAASRPPSRLMKDSFCTHRRIHCSLAPAIPATSLSLNLRLKKVSQDPMVSSSLSLSKLTKYPKKMNEYCAGSY